MEEIKFKMKKKCKINNFISNLPYKTSHTK